LYRYAAGSDVTGVALRCAAENAAANPAVAALIEIRDARRWSSGGGGGGGDGEGGGGGEGGGEGGGGGGVSDEGKGSGAGSGSRDGGEDGGGGGGNAGNASNDAILLTVVREGERFAFCMCNPPFFESMDEAELNPSTNFGGTPDEMCCEGGEEAFVQRIYTDSLVLRDRVYWYTTMCGKKDTMKRLRRLLELRRVPGRAPPLPLCVHVETQKPSKC
jgi:23S rRNA (adenine1618-N6)-methyltransferase